MEIKDGDFVVISSRWRVEVRKATRVTAQLVFYEDGRSRPWRIRIRDVVFAGPEDIARKLVEQLKSSDAQLNADNIAAANRHRERNNKFIADAIAKAEPKP